MESRAPTRLARLGDADRGQLLGLLQRLSETDRRSRFMGGMTDAALVAYVAAIDFAAVVTFGAFGKGGQGGHGGEALVAVTEGFVCEGSGGARSVEAAFVTDPVWRRLGLAQRLFRALAAEASRAGFDRIFACCEARNGAMRSLLRATGAATQVEPGEVSASWPLVPAPARRRRADLTVVANRSATPELAFARTVEVGEDQTARRLFATLTHGAGYAGRLVPAMATGLLVTTIESVCILKLQPLLGARETVVGVEVDVRHLAPGKAGSESCGRRIAA